MKSTKTPKKALTLKKKTVKNLSFRTPSGARTGMITLP